jgi:hypothetical protein
MMEKSMEHEGKGITKDKAKAEVYLAGGAVTRERVKCFSDVPRARNRRGNGLRGT